MCPYPEYRVRWSRPFQHTGVEFASLLYVKGSENMKVWLCHKSSSPGHCLPTFELSGDLIWRGPPGGSKCLSDYYGEPSAASRKRSEELASHMTSSLPSPQRLRLY